jgi:hypothetical protein
MIKDEEIISPIKYNRESKEYGLYKVTRFIEERGKSKVRYYEVKFKNSGNIIEASLKNIIEDTVIDIELKKKVTKKRARVKKKEAIENKYVEKTTLKFEKSEEVRLLSLDLATVSSGWCYSLNGEMKDYNYIYISDANNRLTPRINYMKKEIEKLIIKYDINCIVLENIIHKNFIATSTLAKLQGVILDMIYEKNIPVIKIEVKSWKSQCGINDYKEEDKWDENSRELSKELTYLFVKDIIDIDVKEEFENVEKEHKDKKIWEDVVDALAINYIFYKNGIIRRQYE